MIYKLLLCRTQYSTKILDICFTSFCQARAAIATFHQTLVDVNINVNIKVIVDVNVDIKYQLLMLT
jgi:hypothetical protein